MKKIYYFIMLASAICPALRAQNFKLIDVNKIKNSYPQNNMFSTKNAFAFYNGFSYFTADDGIHGSELWRTNGSLAGTTLVKDVNPGSAPSNVGDYNITASGGKLYFSAFDNTNGKELWVSDGSSNGTDLLVDIALGNISSNPQYLTDVNGTLFFVIDYYDNNTGISYHQLWKTNGTTESTALINDFPNGVGLQNLVNVNGRLFFTFYDFNYGPELYTSDGTTTGTSLVKDINPFGGSFPQHLTSANGFLFFAADDGTGGKLWVSNGSAEGTYAVNNTSNIYLPINYDYGSEINRFRDSFAIRKKILYFPGITSDGTELCRYNHLAAKPDVMIVKDINPEIPSSNPNSITNVNNILYFVINPDGKDPELWKSDGSNAGTVMIKNISPGSNNSYYGLTSAYGILLFAYGNQAQGYELWRSNGTALGTKIVKDINPGTYHSFPQYIAFNNDLFLFGASDGVNGFELWKSDGTTAGTVMIKNINESSTASSYANGFSATANNKVVFSGYDENHGSELWVTDGSEAGTKLFDLFPGPNRSLPTFFTKFKNQTFFFANSEGFYRLWKTDGTKDGTSVIQIPELDNENGNVVNMVATANTLFFTTYNYGNSQYEIWRSDGTTEGTSIIKSDLTYYYYPSPTVVGNILYFVNFDFITGNNQLWKTNGTATGTNLVKNISSFNFNPPSNLYNLNGKLYFSAYTATNSFGPSLWTSDGTDAGTRVVKDVAVIQQPFAQANGKLFFNALDAISKGYELFVSDGTSSGTKAVKDINSGSASSNVYSLVSGDTCIYFGANDGRHGLELWKSNGTTSGTVLVKDITRGINGTYLNQMTNVNNNLFFTANDTLWQSDGTTVNTHPVHDENLKGVSQFWFLTAIGDSLYFQAYSYKAGYEFYVGSAEINKVPVISLSIPYNIVKYSAPANIKLNAIATDDKNAISKVEFYNGSKLLHTEYKLPYDYSWINVAAGNYTLTAKAYDDVGQVGTSRSIKVSVVNENVPPVVTIVNPVDNTTYSSPADIRLIANAKDPNDKISKVDFYRGTTVITTEYTYPYDYIWGNVQPGTYIITARATDEKGLASTSSPVTITVSSKSLPLVSAKQSSVNKKTEINDGISLSLSPNPADNTLQIYTAGLPKNKSLKIILMSSLGVALKTIHASSSDLVVHLDISALLSGVYSIKVINGDKVIYKQFVKL